MNKTYSFTKISYDSAGVELEGLLFKPEGTGPFPALVYVHGFNHSGAWEHVLLAIKLVNQGYSVFMPSQMGFGESKGDRDYCGPKTVQGVLDGIDEFMKNDFVDISKMAIWGHSRGSNVTEFIISKYKTNFKAAVFQSGMYDFKNILDTTVDQEMASNMRRECEDTDEARYERSAINFVEGISCPVLIFHGALDTTYPVGKVYDYEKKLQEFDKTYEIKIFENAGHTIPPADRGPIMRKFLKKYLV